MVITKKKILKTMILPEYLPRFIRLFVSGFSNLSYFIALVYNTVRILPDNHPYLKPTNRGQYSIKQVVAEAANHISLKKENIDQIIVFFSIVAALIITVIQFILLALAFLIPKSYAQDIPQDIRDFFVTPNPQQDLAFQMLNYVFGIPQFFGGGANVTEPIHEGLHNLMAFYSYGMLIVGCFIILYMIITTVMETAHSGIPFGRRFNKTWVPVRLILFFALLLPINYGFNSAQYITLMAAKLGSGLASQGWIAYNSTVFSQNSTLTGQREQNVAIPKQENLMHLPAFMSVVRTCVFSYRANYNQFWPDTWADGVLGWAVYQNEKELWNAINIEDTTYENLIELSKGRDVSVVFGVKDDDEYKQHRANVAPICGVLVLKVTDASQPGSAVIRKAYYDLMMSMWRGERDIDLYAQEFSNLASSITNVTVVRLPNSSYKKNWEDYLKQYMEGDPAAAEVGGVIGEAIEAQRTNGNFNMPPEVAELGWAGAGIWYNKLAEQNGALISALRSTPMPLLYPRVMEKIESANRAENRTGMPNERFTLSFAPGTPGIYINEHEKEISRSLNHVFEYWQKNDGGPTPGIPVTDNAFIDVVNVVLGTQGLFELCRNTNIHPLAQLSMVGKSMLDNSIRSFGYSALFQLLSSQPVMQATTASLSSFFGSIASVGLLIGFMLFYIVPFMPFIYFFFAVGEWIKTIFEAIVGMPLWALAHLRIDGEGIMGDAAEKGYYLIFDIFIRPILIIFGLIASLVIFAAMVKVLNEIYYLVIANTGGNDLRSSAWCFQNPNGNNVFTAAEKNTQLKDVYAGPIDEFFYTIMYAIIVYLIGTSCFKLIDAIPNNILRWINAEVTSLETDDAADGLMKYIALGGNQFGSKIGGSLGGIGDGIKESASQAMKGD